MAADTIANNMKLTMATTTTTTPAPTTTTAALITTSKTTTNTNTTNSIANSTDNSSSSCSANKSKNHKTRNNSSSDHNNKLNSNNANNSNDCDYMIEEELSPNIYKFFQHYANEKGIGGYDLIAKPISCIGENAYGSVLEVCIRPDHSGDHQASLGADDIGERMFVVKISPKNPARRQQMLVVDFYEREVFMYSNVFTEYRKLYLERLHELNYNATAISFMEKNFINLENYDEEHPYRLGFQAVPKMYSASLEANDEFIIFEDLRVGGYVKNSRMDMPTYDLVVAAFRSIAQMHAMSFVLQARKPDVFNSLIAQMKENLFTSDMDPFTLEFGKQYLKRLRNMLEQDPEHQKLHVEIVEKIENNFKQICTQCVQGTDAAPYAVICHGDLWNNNILYKYVDNRIESAKLIDFQVSRYAPPVLDLVHYLYACTEQELRNKHFMEFMNCYYDTLSKYIAFYDLNIDDIYPRHIFLEQLRQNGVFGLCMSAFSIPFFIANSGELPDLDEAAKARQVLSSSSSSSTSLASTSTSDTEDNYDGQQQQTAAANSNDYCLDLLNERTVPIFRRRMSSIVEDLVKYEMVDKVLQL